MAQKPRHLSINKLEQKKRPDTREGHVSINKQELVNYRVWKPRHLSNKQEQKQRPDTKARHLSINKQEQKKIPDTEEGPSHFGFSEDVRHVLKELFTHYPPYDAELNGDAIRSSSNKAANFRRKDSAFCKPRWGKLDIAKKVKMFTAKMNESPQLRKVFENRCKLPIASFKDIISSTLENHQVVLISGETGCGKTTQVPQYILDYMWEKGKSCKIICTQPRRISAVSVAERISAERGEPVGDTVGYKIRLESKGGKHSSIMFCTNGILLRLLIGRGTNNTSNKQCSKRLADDAISEITHIIVDEIHERDSFCDFMLTILRDLLPLYPHLRIVLMSATLDADRFSKYFNGCPIIQVPGFTYPVKTFYLEDVLSILQSAGDNLNSTSCDLKKKCALPDYLRSSLDESINIALVNDEFDPLLEVISAEQRLEIYNYHHSETGVTPLMVFAAKGQLGDVCMLLSCGADCSARDHNKKSALDWAQQANRKEVCAIIRKHMECSSAKPREDSGLKPREDSGLKPKEDSGLKPREDSRLKPREDSGLKPREDSGLKPREDSVLLNNLATKNPEHMQPVLIERLLEKICADSNEGAILVFLPGWEDIIRLRERLLASPLFQDSSKFLVMSLHSMVPALEQINVFKRPPAGVRKIILSTNIAEASVTIDDVVFVIDSGRMKEKSYDPHNNVSILQSSWISKASAKQREGRAGRCQPGTCYHLYSSFRAASLPDYQIPEMKRMPVEELCLQVKLLDSNCKIADFLNKTLDPPLQETTRNAISVLQDLGALTQDEELTELGEEMGSLPLHPSATRMLLFAALMNCLDPALTLACVAGYKDPFLVPMEPDKRKRVATAKVELASLYGGFSDQLAVVAAFDCWRRAKDRGLESEFCTKYFISSGIMNMLSKLRERLKNELLERGFIPADISACSLSSKDPGIMRSVLMAGDYPMVAKLLPRKDGKKSILETASGLKVRLHPRSCNSDLSFSKPSGNPLVIYDEITQGDSGNCIRNCSVVGSCPLLLLSTEMVVAPPDDNGGEKDRNESEAEKNSFVQHTKEIMSSPDNTVIVIVDRWLPFEAMALDVAQIYCLRHRLASAILFKVKNPLDVLPCALEASIHAIACILSYDGLPAMVSSSDVLSNQVSNQNAKELSRLSNGRVVGYIPPNDFLISLSSDKPHTSSSFQKATGCKNRSSLDAPVSSNSRAAQKRTASVADLP